MRKILFLVLMLTMALMSCKEESSTPIKGTFESIDFVREGGGEIKFNLSPTDNPNILKVIVFKYGGIQDANIHFDICQDVESETAFYFFKKAIGAQMQINGNYKQPNAPTGTWVYLFAISGQTRIEITNTQLRDSLLKFESIVQEYLRNN